jgi:pre-mRNA-processing factor 40
VWKEFTAENGQRYYYNAETRKSVWEEPEELRVHKARLAAQSAGLAPSAAAQAAQPVVIHENAGLRSTQQEPVVIQDIQGPTPEAARAQAIAAAAVHAASLNKQAEVIDLDQGDASKSGAGSPRASVEGAQPTAIVVNVSEPAREVPPPRKKAPPKTYRTKEEAIADFRALLLEKGVTSDMKWNSAMRLIINDARFTALKSLGEKKQVFAEFASQRCKAEQEEKRARQKQATEAFTKMLAGCKEIDSRMRWRTAEEILAGDRRLTAVEDGYRREELFNEFVTELGKTEREDRRRERKEAMEHLKEMVKELEDVNAESKWADVRKAMGEKLKSDGRLKMLDVKDVQHEFETHVKTLQEEKQREQQQEKEGRRKVERSNREAFRTLVKTRIDNGEITIDTTWKEFLKGKGPSSPKKGKDESDSEEAGAADTKTAPETAPETGAIAEGVEGDEAYIRMKGQPGSTPEEIFEDLMEQLHEDVKKARKALRKILKVAKNDVEPAQTYADFATTMTKLEAETKEAERDFGLMVKNNEQHVKLAFEDLLEEAKEEQKERERKAKKQVTRFVSLLKDYYYKTEHVGIEWEEAIGDLKRHSAYKELGEKEREPAFVKYMQGLKERKEEKKKRKAEKARKQKGEGKEGKEKEEKKAKGGKEGKDEDDGDDKGRGDKQKDDADGNDEKGDDEKDSRKGKMKERGGDRDRDRDRGRDRDKDRVGGRSRSRDRDRRSMSRDRDGIKGGDRRRDQSRDRRDDRSRERDRDRERRDRDRDRKTDNKDNRASKRKSQDDEDGRDSDGGDDADDRKKGSKSGGGDRESKSSRKKSRSYSRSDDDEDRSSRKRRK